MMNYPPSKFGAEFETDKGELITLWFQSQYDQEEFTSKYRYVEKLIEEAGGKIVIVGGKQ